MAFLCQAQSWFQDLTPVFSFEPMFRWPMIPLAMIRWPVDRLNKSFRRNSL